MYGNGSVVNLKSEPSDFNAKEWTDLGKRKLNYMFLYGPDEPPFLKVKFPCAASASLGPNSQDRTCSLTDLQVHVVDEAPRLLPVQTIVMPTPVLVAVVHTTPVHIKPTWNFPIHLPALGDAISYAAGECRICRKSNCHTITESPRTRWAAETIHHYLGVLAVAGNPGFMIGVVINEDEKLVCVAYSSNSNNDNAKSNLEGCKFQGYKLKLYGNEGFADITTCRGGQNITQHRPLSLVNVGNSGVRSSETCAASKLAKKYLRSGVPLSKWNMTEIAYGTMVGYTDGLAAQSCVGCQNFLPTLLCFASK